MLNSLTKSIGTLLNTNLRAAANCFYEQVRTRITCSKRDGKERTVKTAMQRYFRISKRIWIRSQPGYHHKLWAKPLEKRFLLQQPVICGRRESLMAERMAGPKFRAIKVEKFVDPPFSYYHSYAKQLKAEKDKFHVFP